MVDMYPLNPGQVHQLQNCMCSWSARVRRLFSQCNSTAAAAVSASRRHVQCILNKSIQSVCQLVGSPRQPGDWCAAFGTILLADPNLGDFLKRRMD
jgi:hypothetical protein